MQRFKTHPADPYTPRLDVQIHQVVHHPTLQVVLYPVDDHLLPDVDNLAVSHVRLILIQRLIHPLVHPDPLPEVLRSLFRILTLVVGRRSLDLLDICHDQLLVVALALDEQCLDALRVTPVFDPTPPGLRGVGSVEDGDEVSRGAEPLAHVCHRSLGSSFP